MKRILIVEDEKKLRFELKVFLENNGYEVLMIDKFDNIVNSILKIKVDLILLDLNLPVIDGHTICKELRKSVSTPIIVVTSQNTEIDELISINYGADDFITKPYNSQILLARIANVLKRLTSKRSVIIYEKLEIDLHKSVVMNGDDNIEYSKNEIKILGYLLEKRGEIVSRNQLIDYLWDNDQFVDDNTLTVNINRVRTKLKELGYDKVIETRRGQGYIVL